MGRETRCGRLIENISSAKRKNRNAAGMEASETGNNFRRVPKKMIRAYRAHSEIREESGYKKNKMKTT